MRGAPGGDRRRQSKREKVMTEEAKTKGIEIGAGVILYVTAWGVTSYYTVSRNVEIVLFLLPYVVLSVTTYWDLVSMLIRKQFPDENLLMVIATAGAFCIGRHHEAVAAMLFYQVGKFIEEISLSRTRKSITEYIDIRPEYANLKVGRNEEKIVPPQELKLRQVIVIRPGEKIPVDVVVTLGTGTVDMKALTGESTPKAVKPGDRLYSGSINLNSVLEARVVRLYDDSTAEIMRLVEDAGEKKAENIRFADKFTRLYTPLVILLALLTVILPPMIFDGERQEWVYRGLILLVAACPCGLMVSIPMAFLGGIGSASRQGVLIKGGALLEKLTQVDTYVFDKTGTLTEGVFHVKEIVPEKMEAGKLLQLAALTEMYSTHPIAVSLRDAYEKQIKEKAANGKQTDKKQEGQPEAAKVRGIEEIPGYGVKAYINDHEVYVGNARLMNRQGVFYQPVRDAGTAVHVSVDGEYAGYILISDIIRPDAGKLMKWLRKRELSTVMLTGDNERVAEAVASRLKIESVYAELMPEDKVELLEEFRENQMEGEMVAFVGDGINDAPVLARADIGIAMGGLGADAALEAADIILMEDEPSRIINAVRIAKATLRSVRQNMVFAIGMKVILIVLAFFGLVTMQNAIVADMGVMLINILNSFWMMKYPEQGV